MTSEEWTIVEERLKLVGHPVPLFCDGHQVTYVRGRVSEMKDVIAGFKGLGVSKENILKPDSEEAPRFCRPREVYKWKKSARQAWSKMDRLRRKEVTRHYGPDFDVNEKVKFYDPFWNSFKALKAHLLKNNIEIILIEEPNRGFKPDPEICNPERSEVLDRDEGDISAMAADLPLELKGRTDDQE